MRTITDIVSDFLEWVADKTGNKDYLPNNFLDKTKLSHDELIERETFVWKELYRLLYDKNNGIYWFKKFVLGDMKYGGYPKAIHFNSLWREWTDIMKKSDHIAIKCPRQHGKAQPYSAKVLTPTGWKRMGDIQPGDYVITEKGLRARVLETFEQGEQDIYKIIFDDGSHTRCTLDHLWKVFINNEQKTISLKEVITLLDSGEEVYVPLPRQIEFDNRVHKRTYLEYTKKHNYLPDEYIFDSIYNKDKTFMTLQFRYGKPGSLIETTDKMFAKQVKAFIRSLGGYAKTHKGTTVYYTFKKDKKRIKSVKKWGREQAKCISVADSSQTYITDDYTVTHNSTFWSVILPLYRLFLFKNYNVLIESSSADQASRLLVQISKIINNNELLLRKKDPKAIWNTEQITYNGGTIIAKGIGAEVRGGTHDYIIIDDILRSDNKLSDEDIESFITEELEAMILERKGQMVLIGCVSGDTNVLTENGLVKIKDLHKDKTKKLLPFNKKIYGIGGFNTATETFYNGIKPTKIITTELGNSLECTHNHPILVVNDEGEIVWRRADRLKVGDYCIVINNNNTSTTKITKIEDSEAETYDFIIPKTHSFYSNGFISHNTPKHPTDIFYTVREKAEEGGAWFYKEYKAILDYEKKKVLCPDRYTFGQLIRKKKIMGSERFEKEFMCNPIASGQQLFPDNLRAIAKQLGKNYVVSPKIEKDNKGEWVYYIGVDVARAGTASADYTVVIVLAFNTITMEKRIVWIWREKGLKIKTQAEHIAEISRNFGHPVILVEKNNVGQDLIDEFIDSYNLNVESFTTGASEQKKVDLIRSLIRVFENEKMIFPTGNEQSREMIQVLDEELSRFVTEITRSGNLRMKGAGKSHDDTVMALALANRCTQMSYTPVAVTFEPKYDTELEEYAMTGNGFIIMDMGYDNEK